ncbi:MAG: hypothetical protein ACK5NY_06585 [Burkholderiaceae bacterium]|jgi:pimeloyl-[acyl-carrier protein] methyl ester esterase
MLNKPFGFALWHGWGLTARSLDGLAADLRQRYPDSLVALFDDGYGYDAPHEPPLPPSHRWIGIGHSQGFARLVEFAHDWAGLVSLHGFRWFCHGAAHPVGVAPAQVEHMLQSLTVAPQATVRAFLRKAGGAQTAAAHLQPSLQPGTLALARLQHGLHELRALDLALPSCRLLAVATAGDSIVPAGLSSACFPATALRWLPATVSHLSPCVQSDCYLDALDDFLHAFR